MITHYSCPACGSNKLYIEHNILWDELIDNWQLSSEETAYINKQQGAQCPDCGCNLRSLVLAKALLRVIGADAPLNATQIDLRLLEINECGHLHKYLLRHTLMEYPAIDMRSMHNIEDGAFDIVMHSDTLEHIDTPVVALQECHRILTTPGYCIFTVPTLVDKVTRTTENRPATYHGTRLVADESMRVYTEYGMDAWKQVIEAGFDECRIVTLEYPAGIAYIGVKK